MSVGVIGSVAVRHAAPVDLAAGAFYAFLRRYGVDPGHEANRIAVDFGVERFLRPLAAGEAGQTCQRRLTERRSDRSRTVGQTIANIPAQGFNRWRPERCGQASLA